MSPPTPFSPLPLGGQADALVPWLEKTIAACRSGGDPVYRRIADVLSKSLEDLRGAGSADPAKAGASLAADLQAVGLYALVQELARLYDAATHAAADLAPGSPARAELEQKVAELERVLDKIADAYEALRRGDTGPLANLRAAIS